MPNQQLSNDPKMAAEVDDASKILENPPDVPQGQEPGASRNSMLLASDSYDDIVICLGDQPVVETPVHKRANSGSAIGEILETESASTATVVESDPTENVLNLPDSCACGEDVTDGGGMSRISDSLTKTHLYDTSISSSKDSELNSLDFEEVTNFTAKRNESDSESGSRRSGSGTPVSHNSEPVSHSNRKAENVDNEAVVNNIDKLFPKTVDIGNSSGSSSTTQLETLDDDSVVKTVQECEQISEYQGTSNTNCDIDMKNSKQTVSTNDLMSEQSEKHSTEIPTSVSRTSVSSDESADYVHSSLWREHRKHVFIFSEAGKPIYSRYGDEDRLVTLMGVMQAMVSVVQASKDNLRCMTAGRHKFVFLTREHLVLVAVSSTQESLAQVMLQLNYVYNQIISVLTLSQLCRIFEQRRNYDLRRLLTGAEKFVDNLMTLLEVDPSFLLGAVRCLPLESSVRDTIAQSIVQHAKVKDLVFVILVANNQLIILVRMKKYFLHPADLHLIFNLVSASESFKNAESWTPVCLPKFDPSGYLHAHISYLDPACQVCLLLLTVDRDVFFTLSECKAKILQRLNKYGCLKSVADSLRRGHYRVGDVAIPDLRHFLYKSRSTAQCTCPEYEAPYAAADEQQRVRGLYQYLHQRIHSNTNPLKILFHVGQYETLLGWVTAGFELYAVFGPLVTKLIAINAVNKLLKWIKKEEDRLFILSSPTL